MPVLHTSKEHDQARALSHEPLQGDANAARQRSMAEWIGRKLTAWMAQADLDRNATCAAQDGTHTNYTAGANGYAEFCKHPLSKTCSIYRLQAFHGFPTEANIGPAHVQTLVNAYKQTKDQVLDYVDGIIAKSRHIGYEHNQLANGALLHLRDELWADSIWDWRIASSMGEALALAGWVIP